MRMKTIHGRAVLGRWELAEAVAQTTGNGITEVLEEEEEEGELQQDWPPSPPSPPLQ